MDLRRGAVERGPHLGHAGLFQLEAIIVIGEAAAVGLHLHAFIAHGPGGPHRGDQVFVQGRFPAGEDRRRDARFLRPQEVGLYLPEAFPANTVALPALGAEVAHIVAVKAYLYVYAFH